VDDAFLERWLEAVLATPGLTSLTSVEDARPMLLEDALRAAPMVAAAGGPVVDVGSGGGSPGIPLAVSLPRVEFTLLEAQRRKARFLEHLARDLPNVGVVWGRAEEQTADAYAVALAKALAQPPVAAELCLPLVRPGGIGLVWVGEKAHREPVARVADRLGATLEDDVEGLLVLRKVGETPPGFPRRSGMAKKRPLA
jgi:16S rRNA (guanine527-N7)-methyltransferase